MGSLPASTTVAEPEELDGAAPACVTGPPASAGDEISSGVLWQDASARRVAAQDTTAGLMLRMPGQARPRAKSPTAFVPSVSPDVRRALALRDGLGDDSLQAHLLLGPSEVGEQHPNRQDAGQRVGDVFPSEGRSRSVDGLEHADARIVVRVVATPGDAWMHVGARGHPEAALEGRAEVGHDVAEQVAGHDDLELGRVLHQVQAHRVDVDVARVDRRVLVRHLEEDPVPELVRVAHGVRLVDHVDAPLAAQLRPLEGRAHDALDPFAGVHVLADRELVARTSLELPAHSHVRPLGVLAEDDEVDVLRAAGLERDQAIRQGADGADVGVEVEAEAQSKEDVAGVLEARHARVAEGTEEDGARRPGDAIADVGREGRAVPEVAVCAEVERPEVEGKASGIAVVLEHASRLRDDLRADAVARKDGDELPTDGLVRAAPFGRAAHRRLAHARLSAASLAVTSRALRTRGTSG